MFENTTFGKTTDILKRGMDVAMLQVRLNIWGVPGDDLDIDGKFGPLTREAVRAFQRKFHLDADGIVGSKTQAELEKIADLSSAAHRMSLIPQPTQTTCWAASTAMMTRSTVAAVRSKTPAEMISSDGGLINSSESDQAVVTGARYGAIHGLRCYAPMSWTVSALTAKLRRSPLMFDTLWNAGEYAKGNGSPGHMIVSPAFISDGRLDGSGTYLLIHDPWPPNSGDRYWVEYGDWIRKVPTRTYRIFDRK